jgi:hypothetical protein
MSGQIIQKYIKQLLDENKKFITLCQTDAMKNCAVAKTNCMILLAEKINFSRIYPATPLLPVVRTYRILLSSFIKHIENIRYKKNEIPVYNKPSIKDLIKINICFLTMHFISNTM